MTNPQVQIRQMHGLSVVVSMMNIRGVPMDVRDRRMTMPMGMPARDRFSVIVPMMLIVFMLVLMLDSTMKVFMLVMFSEMQPHAGCH